MLVTVRPPASPLRAVDAARTASPVLKSLPAAFSRQRVQYVRRSARSVKLVNVDASKREVVFIINPQGECSTGEAHVSCLEDLPARKALHHWMLEAREPAYGHVLTAHWRYSPCPENSPQCRRFIVPHKGC